MSSGKSTRRQQGRNEYAVLKGKVVDTIEQVEEDGLVILSIGFSDGTLFDITCGTKIVHAYYADMSSGDEVRLKEFRKFKK
ncbi:MAG TPA: hypothetical protein VJO35_18770 [Terriglobales bacterium]|nr:hypothetical protein [Terriglobales bacterium]